jgi:quercetin dioxygenase-like cupin family protein
MQESMRIHRWEQVAVEQFTPLLAMQTVHRDNITIARVSLRKGAIVPTHSHANEQITTIEQGSLRVRSGGVEVVVNAGDMVTFGPNDPHAVEALEDTIAIDVFAPVREDWRRGDNAYLRSPSKQPEG